MPKPRYCGLCGGELDPYSFATVCARCQAEETSGQAVGAGRQHGPALPPRPSSWDGEVRLLGQGLLARCEECGQVILTRTSICHPTNPVHDCALGFADVAHTHHFCPCGAEQVTVPHIHVHSAPAGAPEQS